MNDNKNLTSEFYSYILNLDRLSQKEVDDLYKSENIGFRPINEEIDFIEKELEGNGEASLLNKIFGTNVDLEEKKEELSKRLYELKSKKVHNLLTNKTETGKTYPSVLLINKIVEGNLYLAYIYAKKYYKKSNYEYSFDDLFQISSEALMSAAKYYIPNGEAKFTTYASKCIDNKLRHETFPVKKKIKIYNSTNQEEANLLLAKKILYVLYNNEYGNNIIYKINKEIKIFNKEMYFVCGRTIKRIPKNSGLTSVFNLYRSLVKDTLLYDFINDFDIEEAYLFSKRNPLSKFKEEIYMLIHLTSSYLNKLEYVNHLIEFEKRYKMANDNILPSEKEYLDSLNNYIKEKNRKIKVAKDKKYVVYDYFEDFSVYYLEEYNVNLLDDGRKHEVEYLEELFSCYKSDIEELEEYLKDNDLKEVEVYFYEYYDEVLISLYKYNGYDDMYFLGKKILTKNDISKILEDFYEKYGNDDLLGYRFAKRVIKSRTMIINSKIKHKNEATKVRNRDIYKMKKLVDLKRRKLIKSKEFTRYYNSIKELYDIDEVLLLEEKNKKSKKMISVEEEIEESIFFEEYSKALSNLTGLERRVIELYYDRNGYHSYTAKEIGKKLNITTGKVYKLKKSAIEKLKNNEKLKSYIEE